MITACARSIGADDGALDAPSMRAAWDKHWGDRLPSTGGFANRDRWSEREREREETERETETDQRADHDDAEW